MKPSLIVVTPVRNESWVLDAFLTAASSWADHIIIVDQHSSDGSREIAMAYPKVTLIDNPDPEWHEMDARALSLEAASKIPGDKIIFGLDADEFLSTSFEKSEGWRTILNSKPNTVFCFRWLNLFDNFHTVEYAQGFMDWACHYDDSVDIVAEYRKREHHSVHACRIPCLEDARATYLMIDDIRFVHLAKLNKERTRNKLDFYQVTAIDKNPQKSNPIALSRSYARFYPPQTQKLVEDISLSTMGIPDRDIKIKIKDADYGKHYIDEMISVFHHSGIKKFIKLNIWDNPRLLEAGMNPNRPMLVKLVHFYLKKTQSHINCKIIKFIDYILKKIF